MVPDREDINEAIERIERASEIVYVFDDTQMHAKKDILTILKFIDGLKQKVSIKNELIRRYVDEINGLKNDLREMETELSELSKYRETLEKWKQETNTADN